jgi:hypothetical protein
LCCQSVENSAQHFVIALAVAQATEFWVGPVLVYMGVLDIFTVCLYNFVGVAGALPPRCSSFSRHNPEAAMAQLIFELRGGPGAGAVLIHAGIEAKVPFIGLGALDSFAQVYYSHATGLIRYLHVLDTYTCCA